MERPAVSIAGRWPCARSTPRTSANGSASSGSSASFQIDFSSERYQATACQALSDAGCTVRPLDKKRWDAELETLRAVFNETFRGEWEFRAMTKEEFRELFDQFKVVLDTRQFMFAEVDVSCSGPSATTAPG